MLKELRSRVPGRSAVRRATVWLGLLAVATATLIPIGSSQANAATVPELGIGSVAVTEGDVGFVPARLTVTLSSPVLTDTIVEYVAVAGTATTPTDYLRRAGRVRIRAGRTLATIGARLVSDTAVEGDESFSIMLTAAGGVPIAHPTGTVTIRDDDPMSGGRLAIGDASVYEGDASQIPLRFTVNLDAPLVNDVTAVYTSFGGTAAAGVDFLSRSRTLRIRAGRTSTVLTFKSLGDVVVEGSEQFTVVLSAVVGATTIDDTAAGTVLDDDPPLITAPTAPTLNSAAAGPANGMLAVLWSAPVFDGGSPVTGYELEITRPAGAVVGTYTSTGANVVCGSPGVTCSLRVRAENTVGFSEWSEPIDGTTWRAPSAVGGLVLSGENHSVRAVWSTPLDAGDFPILDYRVERSVDGTNFTFDELATFRTSTVSCGGERVTCWVRVRARNAAGLGPMSEASATTWGRPTAPTLISIRRAAGTSVGLGWTPPTDDGGTAVFDYTGERTIDGGLSWTPVGSVAFFPPTCPVGVSCGFRVSAVNVVGTSAASNVLTVGP